MKNLVRANNGASSSASSSKDGKHRISKKCAPAANLFPLNFLLRQKIHLPKKISNLGLMTSLLLCILALCIYIVSINQRNQFQKQKKSPAALLARVVDYSFR